MNMEKMKKVFSDEAFVKALFEMETVTEMQQALSSKGIQMSDEEVAGIRDFFDKVKRGEISREQLEAWSKLAENGELSEETLEQAAGGSLSGGRHHIRGFQRGKCNLFSRFVTKYFPTKTIFTL